MLRNERIKRRPVLIAVDVALHQYLMQRAFNRYLLNERRLRGEPDMIRR